MSSQVEPIRKEIMIEAPQERAFRVFTTDIVAWWPREHHIGKAEMKLAIMEPKVGGRWYEVGVDYGAAAEQMRGMLDPGGTRQMDRFKVVADQG